MTQEQDKPATASATRSLTTTNPSPEGTVVEALVSSIRPFLSDHPQRVMGAVEQATALQALCHQLRATHRCPGECVLSASRQERRLREMEARRISSRDGFE